MKKAYLFPLKKSFAIHEVIGDPLTYEESVGRHIESIWEVERSSKTLFDHNVLSIRSYRDGNFFVTQVPYKVCFAAVHDNALRRLLKVYPLAVCGRTICDGAILLARRSLRLATDGGEFECCPSGGVDGSHIRADHVVDLQAALIQEFFEETRLSTALIQSIEPKCCVWTVDQGVFDICFDIKLHSNAILPHETAECSEFRWWRPGDSTDGIIAPSRALLEQYTNDI
jgi:hypothetical protein